MKRSITLVLVTAVAAVGCAAPDENHPTGSGKDGPAATQPEDTQAEKRDRVLAGLDATSRHLDAAGRLADRATSGSMAEGCAVLPELKREIDAAYEEFEAVRDEALDFSRRNVRLVDGGLRVMREGYYELVTLCSASSVPSI